MPPIASPAKNGIVKLKDSDVGFHYCEFPNDVFFMESIAQNTQFDSKRAYVPVNRMINGKSEAHIYTMTATSKQAKHFLGPITVGKDNSKDITIFGSALSKSGILYLCAFNRNSIVAVDLTSVKNNKGKDTSGDQLAFANKAILEITDVPAPNDVAIDPLQEDLLWVAGGTFAKTFCGTTKFTNAARGNVVRLQLNMDTKKKPTALKKQSVSASGLTTLAGIHVTKNANVWIAELQDMLVLDKNKGGKQKATEVWSGEDGNGRVWMSDNVDLMPVLNASEGGGEETENIILCPAYTTLPQVLVDKVLDRARLASTAALVGQLVSATLDDDETFGEALRDPELNLAFSNTFIDEEKDEPEPVRIILIEDIKSQNKKTQNSKVPACMHFEVDLVQTRAEHEPYTVRDLKTGKEKGRRHFFNEQVTHSTHLVDSSGKKNKSGNSQGYIACVNFEQTRILMLKDDVFQMEWSEKRNN